MPGIFSPSSRVGIVSTSFEHDERLLRVGLHDLRVDHLAGDVEERGDIDAVARFQHAHAAGAARIEHADPFAAVGHERLGQVADAEVLRLEMAFAQGFGEMADGLLGAVEVVAAFEFAVFQSHVEIAPVG